ncbi:polysaccharide biosynthesis protein [Bacillaceae bacterium SIJ1]|uniref:putative polysaccharide biosynthesis protein n=1 Tax=Litoribacterium kuwaitense TaxID=1398745 RepID=UPI0013EC3F97|nr:polysaccharide biosynthesis protein [Litoribacterium kuwaitense]NGP44955.1 polysaccharide biosynthesis protein [Litoribacterium kuwaitense]
MSTPSFVKSALIITMATLVSKVLGSVFLIPLQNIAGDEVFGIFRFVYPFYMVALILSVAGIPIAISKLISEARAEGHSSSVRDIFATASILALAFGVVTFSLMFSLSGPFAKWFWNDTAQLSLAVVSVTLLVAPYMAVYRGFFQGFDDMRPTAFSQMFEQFVRAGVTLIAAYVFVQLGTDVSTLAGYVMTGSIAGVVVSLFYLRWTWIRSPFRPHAEEPYTVARFLSWSKRILSLSLPVAVGTLTMALLNLVDSMTIPNALDGDPSILYSLYGRGVTLVQIATVFSSAIILPLIPRITRALTTNNDGEAKLFVTRSLNMAHLISWPAAVGLVALVVPVNIALFKDASGSEAIALLSVSSLFTSFSVLTTGILQGIGRARMAAYIIIGAVLIKAMLNMWLTQTASISGAAIATIIVYALIWLVNVWLSQRTLPYSVQWRTPIVCFIASVIMGAFIGTPWLLIDGLVSSRGSALLYVIIAIPVGALLYAALVLFGRGVNRDELQMIPGASRFFKKTLH